MARTGTAEEVIAALGLMPHPEGGFFRETWRDVPGSGGRGAWSCIYYLLRQGERSHWHRIRDAAEIWHHYGGAPLELTVAQRSGTQSAFLLGPELARGERPQALVPAGDWQTARSLGDWSLVGCTVSPAFEFAVFELAPPGWHPGRRPESAELHADAGQPAG